MTLYTGARLHLHELDLDGKPTGPPIASGRLLGDRIYPVRDDVYAFVVEDDGRIGAWSLTSDITAAFVEVPESIPACPPPPPGPPPAGLGYPVP